MSESITANNRNTHQQLTTWYLYIIENKLGQLYTGVTTSPQKRIAQHRGIISGGARALKGKAPLHFKVLFSIGTRSQALKAEHQVKRLTRAQKLAVINTKTLPEHVEITGHIIDHHQFDE